MGQKLKEYYEKAKAIGDFKAAGRLALITKIPSINTLNVPDSPENIAIFESAIQEIRKEFNKYN